MRTNLSFVTLHTADYDRVVDWNYSRQVAPQGRLSRSRMVQHRLVNPIAIAGVR